ncbi:hypothetical protein EV178_000752 [Coemansia sp. RSA 1646]|nr:hypothetical protein EV178_000752 [Coemansia sp. RSA 1646]KAJ2217401.1 hypothetical protein EV179_000551 [Coemansia sp. RSA 487]
MYDYVRRQQELQPSMFSTKTFQWMDQSVREPSWVRRYSKTGPMDPLAYSSSSLFAAQRSTSRLGGTLGVFHRSAASLTPHRALLALRRHRQNSDAAVRPPSGVPSSFRSRRRGFTAPPGTQPPPASPLFAAASPSSPAAVAALMNKVRLSRPAAGVTTQTHFTPAHQRQRNGGGLKRQHQQRFPEIRAPRTDPTNPYRISSVLCVPTKDTLASSDSIDSNPKDPKGAGPDTGMQQAATGRVHSRSTPPRGLPSGKQPRVLPRSPLANPAVILTNADEIDDPLSSSGSDTEPSARTDAPQNAKPVSAESSLSSDDDGLTCRVCNRYRGLEWIVGCNNDHHLCFGCVQAHVKQLLTVTDAFCVPCPLNRCDAHIPSKYLRDCLPPQRIQQLEANRRRSSRPARAITRYFSLDGRKAIASRAVAGSSEEGFDAPVVVVDNSSAIELEPRTHTDQQSISSDAMLSNRALEMAMARVSVADPQRFSTSMPSLPHASANPDLPEAADLSAPLFMSELTKVSTERDSVNSVVLAASVAADSKQSLSPESLGSRLRRMPKIQGNLNADILSIGSPENVAANCLELSSPSLGQPVFFHPGTTAQEDVDPPHAYAGHVYDYSAVDFDLYMHTSPRPPHAMSFASSGSPISWQSPAWAADQRRHRNVPSIICPKQQPEAPPPLPLQFRATATWITPEQRHSGYAENILLNATLFETIRRRSTPSDGDDSDDGYNNASQLPRTYTAQRHPVPEIPETPSTANNDDDDTGVYIPTWRRPDTAMREYIASPWDDSTQYGSQSGILCEAAELNFDLYETLHKRR